MARTSPEPKRTVVLGPGREAAPSRSSAAAADSEIHPQQPRVRSRAKFPRITDDAQADDEMDVDPTPARTGGTATGSPGVYVQPGPAVPTASKAWLRVKRQQASISSPALQGGEIEIHVPTDSEDEPAAAPARPTS
eukprot:11951060-Prorocentrum_lima.AAC.1